jgi:hypothetical protein
MVPYFGKSFTGSGAPIVSLNKSLTLNQVMEIFSAQYAQYPSWHPTTSYANGIKVIPPTGATCGYYYSSSGGTSGTTQPIWPLNVNGTVTETSGSPLITWTNSGAAPTLAQLKNLIGAEGNNYYTDTQISSNYAHTGYRVINNHFVTFDTTNVEQPCTDSTHCIDNTHFLADNGRYLKVTIGFRSDDDNRTGETLTTLFVQRCKQN